MTEQQKKPQVEDEIHAILDGERKETALLFAAWLRENQLAPQPWFGPGWWRIPFGEYYLCAMIVANANWNVFFFKGDYSGVHDEKFVKAVTDCVFPCTKCHGEGWTQCKGIPATIFGKEFTDTCFQFPIQFDNPCVEALEHVKTLIEYWKEAATRSDSWHCR